MERHQIRFYARDKGINRRLFTIPFAVVAVIMAVLFLLRPVNYFLAGALISLFLLYTLGYLIAAAVMQFEYDPYSYETIFYIGTGLLVLASLISHIMVMMDIRQFELGDPRIIDRILSAFTGATRLFVIASVPFVAVYSCFLLITNIVLIRKQGFKTSNMYGMFFAAVMIIWVTVLLLMDFYVSGSMEEVMAHDLIINFFASLFLYFEFMLIGLMITNSVVTGYEPQKDKDFILILGCGLNRDGTPSPLLKGRIDRALEFYNQQKKTAKAPMLVASGGQGSNEAVPESRAIRNYLVEHGVPEYHIIEEDDSTSTRENMNFSWLLIDDPEVDEKVAFSTTNYHVFRSGMMARQAGVKAEGMAADTKWYYWPNATVREYIGFLTENRAKQLMAVAGMILIYSVLIVVSFI